MRAKLLIDWICAVQVVGVDVGGGRAAALVLVADGDGGGVGCGADNIAGGFAAVYKMSERVAAPSRFVGFSLTHAEMKRNLVER